MPNDLEARAPDVGPVGRVYRINGGPGDGQWFWVMHANAGGQWQNVTGRAASRNAAALQVAQALSAVLKQ